MRRGRPGLVGMAARTAVVAGTAGAVSHHQQQKYAANDQAANAGEQEAYDAGVQAAQQQAMQPAPVAAPAAPAEDPTTAKLQQLASLHEQGILTDEEFAAAKAKALGL
jgi:Short C-terminal domain